MTTSADQLTQLGIPDQAALKLGNTIRTIAGVGTAQTGAASLTVNTALLTTAGGATAFVFPTTWAAGDQVTVYNTSATTALIYPETGSSIDGGSANASVSVAQNASRTFTKVSATAWRSTASAQAAAQGAITADSITGSSSTLPVTGLAGTQGGSASLVGGASSTSANAGGAVSLLGGAGGATGVGGAATLTGAAGGATSGVGGAATIAGGAGTAGNSAGGVASLTGGAGQGSAAGGVGKTAGGLAGATGAGGAAQLTGGAGGATSGSGGAAQVAGGAGTNGNATGGVATVTGGAGQGTGNGAAASVIGGASGAGATGNGGAANVTGGAAASTAGSGGSVVLTGGALSGSGTNGGVRTLSLDLVTMAAPAAKTTSTTLTAAEILGGLITANQGAAGAATYTMPLGTSLGAALPADVAIGDTFWFSIINISVNASEIVTVAGNTGTTAVGNMTIASNQATTNQAWGSFLVRMTAANVFSFYRVG